MIPTVGRHIVLLGKDENYQEKFDRLFSFYKQVWTKVGFETYEKLDVRFSGQVVATLKGTKATQIIDSAKAKEAIEALVANDKTDTADVDAERRPNVVPVVAVVYHPTVAKDTTRIKAKVPAVKPKPLAIMQKPKAYNILPKAKNKKPIAVRKPGKPALTSEEEKIRKEAMKHLNQQHNSKQPVVKKKVVKQKV